MSVVFITIPGNERRRFAHELAQKPGISLELVIVQKPRKKPLAERVRKFWHQHPIKIIKEFWYGLLLRIDRNIQERLRYFSPTSSTEEYGPYHKTLEVDSVNSDLVHETLSRLAPDLLIVWGNTILDQRILKTAKRSINLHFGLCPYYRGALANQYAVICDDLERLGATIHFINGKPDAGEILATITPEKPLPPRELFQDLHSKAVGKFLDIAHQLAIGKELPARSQDITGSRNFLLKHWTPSIRYKLGRKIMDWEKEFYS